MPYNRAEGLAWLDRPYVIHTRFEVYDGVGKWQNLGSHAAEDWFRGAEWGGDIDTPITELRAELALKIGDKRLSPLITRTLDVSRAVQLKYALTPPGTPAGSVTAWRRGFRGFIDDIDISPDGNTLTLACTDQASLLRDTFIEEPEEKRRIFGSKTGVLREEVMRQLLKTFGMGHVQLSVPEPSASYVLPYLQTRTSLWQALQEHALQVGWDLRYRYYAAGAADGLGDFHLTFQEPGRAKEGADYRLALKDYLSLRPVKLSLPDIRNVVEVTYQDAVLKRKHTVRRQHIDSMQRYNRRYMALQEEAGSLIDTEPEAVRLAASVLADLAYPKATTGFDRLFWPYVELGDVVQLEADYVTFDVEPQLAVTSFRHTLRHDRERTEVSLRDERPAAAHTRWLERQAGVKGVDLPIPVLPGNRPLRKEPPMLTTATRGPRDDQKAYIDVSWVEDPKGITEYMNVRWRNSDVESAWDSGASEVGAVAMRIPVVENGARFEVQIQVVSPRGTVGAWSNSAVIRAAVDQIPPDPVSGVRYQPPVDANAHVYDGVISWDRSYQRDWRRTFYRARYDNEPYDEGYWQTDGTDFHPALNLFYNNERGRWPLRAEKFWVQIWHQDEAFNDSRIFEAGPLTIEGAAGEIPGILIGPTGDGDPGDAGSGVGDGSGEGDEGGGSGGGGEPSPQLGAGARLVGNAIVVAPETYNPEVLTDEAGELVDRLKRIGKIDNNEFGWYTNIRPWNGKTGTGNFGGQYHCCRKIQGVAHTLSIPFMVSGDLALLDMMAYAWERFNSAIEGPGRAKADKSGPDRTQADGFAGIPYGNAPSGAIITVTGREIPLEDGVGSAGLGIIYMFLRLNQGRYSPRHEKVGDRPASPAYYKARANEVKDYIVNHQRAKYDALYSGKIYGGDGKSAYKLELPLWVGKGFAHTQWSEIAQAVAVAFADGGSNWTQHDDYKQARLAAGMILGHEYDGGQSGSVRWCKTSFGDALYWGQYCQYWQGSYKDGKRVPRTTTQFTQPGTYLNETCAHMNFIKLMSGDDIISDYEMAGAARTYAYSVLNPKLTKDRLMSGNMSSNGTVLPDTWFDSPGAPYDLVKVIEGAYSILMTYDSTGRFEEVVLGEWNRLKQPAVRAGWPIAKLNDLLVRGEARL